MTSPSGIVLAPPVGLEGIISRFGDCRHVVPGTPGETAWKQLILRYIQLPSPLHLPGGALQTRVGCHKDVAEELTIILGEIWPHVKSIGCYNFRKSRTSDKLSTHCWGIAVDINAETNQMGTRGNMPPEVIAAFKVRGWRWGGDWQHSDPMHFQRCSGY